MISTKIEQWVKIVAIALLTISALMYAGAQKQMARSDARFTIEGTATVTATPDLATFSFSVLTTGENADSIQEDNINRTNTAIAYVKEQGVAEKDIQTSYYDIYPNYSYNCDDGNCDSEISGYTMEQTIKVTVRDTEMLGTLLSGVVTAGADTVDGPWFELDDSTEFEQQAREKAFDDARAKAEQIASAGGFKIGRVIDVYEWTDNWDGYYSYAEQTVGMGGSDLAIPEIEAGEEEVTVNVSITYEIK